VQTLSRVNRTCPGKTETFILDFVNSREDILSAFQDYYQETGIDETTDPNTIYDIKNTLDRFMLYTVSEIDAFAKVFFKETKNQGNIDLAKLNSFIDPAVDRYNALSDEQNKIDFKSALSKFIRLYSFLTHIIKLGDENLHKFYAYAKCLLRKLPKDVCERTPNLDSEVSLQYYRLQRSYEGSISLIKEDGVLYGKTSGTGQLIDDEKENLSAIIQRLNERLGTNFTEMDKVLEQFVQDMASNEEMVLRAKNPIDLFKIIYDNTIMDVVLGRMTKNQEFCERYLDDEEFRKEIDKILLPLVHSRLSKI
jgi:type I restriction enzyme R subunit